MHQQHITVSAADRKALIELLVSARFDRRIPAENIEALNKELLRAKVLHPAELPSDVVTLNSTVWFRDLDWEDVEQYTLVLPQEADASRQRISVLAPIGTALLGYRAGDVIEWRVPRGKCRLEILKVVQGDAKRPLEPAEMVA